MDAALAQPPTYQLNTCIPNEIYQPLLDIAQQGYETNDVIRWYLDIRRTLYQFDAVKVPVPYSLTPPFSVCSPAPHDPHAQLFDNEPVSPSEANISAPTLYDGAQTNMPHWSDAFAFNASKGSQLDVTTPTSAPPHRTGTLPTDTSNTITHMISHWNSTATGFPEIASGDIPNTKAESQSSTDNGSSSTRWLGPAAFTNLSNASRKRSASQISHYEFPMSNTPMPLLIPSESSPGQDAPPFFPGTMSTEITYLPPISIVPSRKRRKTKGVQKFIQPLQVQRQSTQ